MYDVVDEQLALNALKRSQQARWGSSSAGSRAITGHSAQALEISGYDVAKDDTEAREIADEYLLDVRRARPMRHYLYHGFDGPWSARVGDVVRRPLTALSDDVDLARGFAHGEQAVLLKFAPGTKAFRYSDVEWITAGDFVVQAVRSGHDPFWGTPLTVVTLRPV